MRGNHVAFVGAICVTIGWLLASMLTPPVARVQSLPQERTARTNAAPATPGGHRRQVAKVGNWSESCSAPNAATASWRPLAPSVACRVPIRNGERARAGLSSIPWFFRRASDAASGARAEDLMPESRPTRICGRSAPHPSSNVIGAGACASDHVVER